MKGDDIMLNKTPLRLIASEESPHDHDDEQGGGAPVISISDEQAITRKVPESAMIAAHEALAEVPKRLPTWHKLVPAGVVALVVIVFAVALARTGREAVPAAPAASTAPPTTPQAGAPPPAAAQPAPVPTPVPTPVLAAPPPATNVAPDVIRIEIDAVPVETELSLDGNVLAGHHLSLRVPRDRGIHVVSASARGYVPFNQQVSFASDVVLKINLRRAQGSAARAPVRPRPSPVEARPRSENRAATPAAGPRIEPGMSLDGPARRPHAKPIDERNPYQP